MKTLFHIGGLVGAVLGALSLVLVACTEPSINLSDTADSYSTKKVMLDTTVRVRAEKGMGSGVIVERKLVGAGLWEYRVVTNAHVVGKDVMVLLDLRQGVTRVGKVLATNEDRDLALVSFTDLASTIPVAPILPRMEGLAIFDQVFAVGGGMGYTAFPTVGVVSSTWFCFEGDKVNCFVHASAPIAPGNSGGGLWRWSKHRNQYELVGITTAVPVAYRTYPMWHMSMSVPHSSVLIFIKQKVDNSGPST